MNRLSHIIFNIFWKVYLLDKNFGIPLNLLIILEGYLDSLLVK